MGEANELVNLLGENRKMSAKEASDPVGKKINKLSDRMLTMAASLEDMQAESDWDDTTLRKSGAVPQGQLQTLDRRSLASGLAMVPLIGIAGQANSAILREDQSAPSGDNNAYVKALVDISKKNKKANDKGRAQTREWNAKRYSIDNVNRIKGPVWGQGAAGPDRFDGKGKTVWDKQRADFEVLKATGPVAVGRPQLASPPSSEMPQSCSTFAFCYSRALRGAKAEKAPPGGWFSRGRPLALLPL